MREFILAKNLNARHDQSIHTALNVFFCDLCIMRGNVLCKRKLEVETVRKRDEYLLENNGNKIIFPNLFIEFDVLVIRA